LHIRDAAALYKLVINSEYYFGEGYVNGGLDVEGNMSTLLETIFLSLRHKNPTPYSAFRRALYYLAKRRRSNSLRGSRKNIHHHYDMGNDFYSLWLDKEM
jgi:cyclopropane-fatty-acyl-phospholipid synthase